MPERGPAVFLDYDQAALDAAHDQAAYAEPRAADPAPDPPQRAGAPPHRRAGARRLGPQRDRAARHLSRRRRRSTHLRVYSWRVVPGCGSAAEEPLGRELDSNFRFRGRCKRGLRRKSPASCMPPSIICGCRREPSAQAQSEISEPNPYRARNRKFESISLLRRVNKLSVPLFETAPFELAFPMGRERDRG